MAALPRCFPVTLLLLAGVLLQAAAAPPGDGEPLAAGETRERSIGSQERQAWRIRVTAGSPLLVTVEQQGIDLAVEDRAPEETEAARVDAPNGRWGPETLVLTAAGEHRIEVIAAEPKSQPGRYTIAVAALPDDRRAAAEAAFLAARRTAAGTPDGWREAADLERRAAAAWHALNGRRQEAEAVDGLAGLQQLLGDLQASVAERRRSLALWRELGDERREASALGWLGSAQGRLGDVTGARASLSASLALWQRLGDRFGEAETRRYLCLAEQTAGELPEALACYEEDRALFHALGDSSREAVLENNLGGVYDLEGKPDEALASYEQALALRRELGDRRGEAETLNNVAVVHRSVGEWQEALRIYFQVQEILKQAPDPLQEAAVLNNLGFAYLNLGEPRRALTYLQGSLEKIGDRRSEVRVRNNLGLAYRGLGDLPAALDQHQQALKLAAGNGSQEAEARRNLAEIHLERGEPAAALDEIDRALGLLAKLGMHRSEASALELRGRALTLAGRPGEAVSVLRDLLSRRQALRDRAGEAATLYELARAERRLGLAAEARAHAEAAVARVEELRAGFLTPDLRAAFLATQHRAYSLRIDLLLERRAGEPRRDDERRALEVSEAAHARSLLDTLYQGASEHAANVPAALLERRQALERRLSALAGYQVARDRGGEKAPGALVRESEKVLAELGEVAADVRRLAPDNAGALRPPDAGGIAALLDPGTLFLEYSLGEDGSHVWAVGSGSFRSAPLPPQREIEELARRTRGELSTVEAGRGTRYPATDALSQALLAPVWDEVAHASRIVVVPDGALHFVPFGALRVPSAGGRWDDPAGRAPLLQACEVVHLPSAGTLALQRQRLAGRAPAPHRVAILADPVFSADDPRLNPSAREKSRIAQVRGVDPRSPGLDRLYASHHEAEVIASLAPPGEAWTAEGFAADRETVVSGGLRSYRILHFASHGVANSRSPELSGLVFSLVDAGGRPRDGFVSLRDIYGLDLAADLVVLSGCETALGPEVRGEGLTSLTRGFLYAGVPRVVATLWQAEDHATAELMKRFYAAMWQDGLPPAAALRKAQLALREDPRRRAPYYWAGFLLQGDWR